MFLCACVRFFQISASVAEIFLRKVKVGARVKSRRWCKYGQRCGVPSEQRFCHVQRPHPPRSTALLSIVTTVASNRETERQPRSNGKRLLRLSFWTSFTSVAKGWCSLSWSRTCGAFLGVASRGRALFTSGWRHHFRLSRDVDRSHRAIAPAVARPVNRWALPSVFDVLALSALGVFLLAFAETSSSVQSIRIQTSRNTSDKEFAKKKIERSNGRETRNFGSDSRKYCG